MSSRVTRSYSAAAAVGAFLTLHRAKATAARGPAPPGPACTVPGSQPAVSRCGCSGAWNAFFRSKFNSRPRASF